MLSLDGGRGTGLDAGALGHLFDHLCSVERLLLAVSGGPDSMALMGLAAAWRSGAGGPALLVATVDHGLRPGSRQEAGMVAEAAGRLGLPHAVLEWTGPKPATRLQETARRARYALLCAHARQIGASHIATAHTLDDQAETILFRMARGSGPAGLTGMRACSPRDGVVHARPLLGVRKAVLVETCRRNGWAFVEDPSNRDAKFARTRWRGLLPALVREGLTPERLAALGERLARAEAALSLQAAAAHEATRLPGRPQEQRFDARRLLEEPAEIVVRVVGLAVREVGGAQTTLRLQRLERLCEHLREAFAAARPFRRTLGGALLWTRSDGTLLIGREATRRHQGVMAPDGRAA